MTVEEDTGGHEVRTRKSKKDPEILTAMGSLYFHAVQPDVTTVPERYRPLPPERAAEIIAKDRSTAGEQRRVRAATRLATSPIGPTQRNTLECLGCETSKIDVLVRDWWAQAPQTGQRKPGAGATQAPTFPDVPPALLDAVAQELTPDARSTTCRRSVPRSKPSFDFWTGTAAVESTISVERPFERLAAVFDPQNWDECSDFFIDTHATAQPPPPAGQPWSGPLFEHFAYAVGPLELASFQVMLDIRISDPAPDRRRIEYRLDEVRSAEIWGFRPGNGPGLTVDDGFIDIRPDPERPGRYLCNGRKEIRLDGWGGFLDYWMTFWTSIGFWVLSDEIYDMVCCNPD